MCFAFLFILIQQTIIVLIFALNVVGDWIIQISQHIIKPNLGSNCLAAAMKKQKGCEDHLHPSNTSISLELLLSS
jgi:hypothetical protein